MSNGVNHSLRLAVYGFDDRSRETLRLAFEGPGKGCGVLVDDSSAEAGIFNMDAANASELWSDYRSRFPERPTIIMAIRDPNIAGTFYVPKPVRIDAMIRAVEDVRRAMPHNQADMSIVLDLEDSIPAAVRAGVATASAAPVATASVAEEVAVASPETAEPEAAGASVARAVPAAGTVKKEPVPQAIKARVASTPKETSRRETYYDPLELLQGQIQDALDQANKKYVAVQLNIQVDENDWQSITFLPGVKRVLTTLSDEQLKHLCSTPLDLLNCTIKRHKGDETFNMIRKVTDEKSGQSLDVFLWKVVVWSSKGRLPAGTNLSNPVKLKHWPNLTRFYPIPNAMRIATLIIDQPRPLPLVIKVLNLPQSHVFAFFSAANAIGLVANNEGVGASPVAEAATPQKHKHHSLFGRILKRLRGSGGA
ncbi:MAG TPA: hypothetical protein ENK35_02905 [Candidatus Tenderia sp.]|nr:hypothetical protein [Candidatus Tenderia sp.]